MASLSHVRKRFVMVVMVFLVIDVAAVAFLLSPWGRSPVQRIDEYNRARNERNQKAHDIQPLTGMEEKLKRADKDSDAFLETRLPAQGSQISNEIGKLAAANHVKLDQATYDTQDAELPGVQRIAVKASLTADYLNLMRFINALEREKMLMVIDSVKLNESQGGEVKVDLLVEAYKKAGA